MLIHLIKIFQEHIKCHLCDYLQVNRIIMDEHHGGIPGFSTLTAKSMIDYHNGPAIDSDRACIVLSTDLSSAYDTVNHEILCEKLAY